jgi:hypothetical protein
MPRMLVVLTFALAACSPATSSSSTSSPMDASVPEESPLLSVMDGQVGFSGFPAINADGSTVVGISYGYDFYGGALVFMDTRTGESTDDIELPESCDEEGSCTVDRAEMDRINAVLAGYTSLPHMHATGARFERDGVSVQERRNEDDDTASVTITRRGVSRDYERELGLELTGAAIANDHSFVVVEELFCACECAYSPSLLVF